MTTVGYSGAPKMMAWVANQLSDYGYNVDLITYFKNDDLQPMTENINRIEFNVEHKSNSAIGKAWENIKPALLLRSYIIKNRPDIVLLFSNLTSFLYLKYLHPRNIRVIISERGDPTTVGKFGAFLRKSYNKADGIVCQTDGAAEALPQELRSRCIVIPNPATQKIQERIPWNKRENVIAFPARFDNIQKRQDLMVKAFQIVYKEFPDLKLVFYGDGTDMKMIKKMVRESGIEDYVVFAGRVCPIQDYIRYAKIVVLTSDFEGIPNSLLDAMALGLPVVATDCTPGGARFLIENNKNGILVNRGDAKAVANGIIYLLSNPDAAELMGTNAQRVLERFEPKQIAMQWMDYIEQIIKR